MEQIGYSLIDAVGKEIQFFGDFAGQIHGLPDFIRLPNGDDVHCPTTDLIDDQYRLVERWLEYGTAENIVFDGTKIIVTRLQPPVPVPASISDRQFFQLLAISGRITQTEALAAVQTGAIPATMQTFIDTLSEADKFSVEMLLSGATIFERSNRWTNEIGVAFEMTSNEIDDFFRAANQL